MQIVKDVINWACGPVQFFTLSTLLFFVMLRFRGWVTPGPRCCSGESSSSSA